jgi:malic enzyme
MKEIDNLIEKWEKEAANYEKKSYEAFRDFKERRTLYAWTKQLRKCTKDLKKLGDSHVERNVLIDFIKELKKEFADVNLDYLDFAAERFLNQLKP